jgi:hypothetical protein
MTVRGKGLVEIPAIKSSLCGLSHIAAEVDPVKRHLMDERHMASYFWIEPRRDICRRTRSHCSRILSSGEGCALTARFDCPITRSQAR